ncbi:hypothetical protein L195_g035827 [Trifolium pratense]|uniref:Uncharacterized protein n=1 Tax=Trifolium pratense TaxID=57577 RepID=A0A2K3LMT9_TRIPR|nr:hypothetical protein L195_g035827 [Trifolium pratense]
MSEPWLKKKDGLWVQSPQERDVANYIIAVPLFDTVEEDKFVWVDDVYENYSVKSGYNMLNPTLADVTRTEHEVLRSGSGFGRCTRHRKLSTCYGVFARSVYKREFD